MPIDPPAVDEIDQPVGPAPPPDAVPDDWDAMLEGAPPADPEDLPGPLPHRRSFVGLLDDGVVGASPATDLELLPPRRPVFDPGVPVDPDHPPQMPAGRIDTPKVWPK